MNVRKVITVVLAIIFMIAAVAQAEDPVYFDDANLKAAIEEVLGIQNPTPTDMLSLYYLDALNDRGIVNLKGIERATNLRRLNLLGNLISDIKPLSSLGNLIELNLERNDINDISPLSDLMALETLWLNLNQISDITPLSGLPNLSHLGLGTNLISDISSLSGLKNLEVLDLEHNQISDIVTLSGLTNLTRLLLENNVISDISPLSGLTNIDDLHLGNTHLTDISPLASLTNMKYLWLYCNQINDISPLAGLTSLIDLKVHNNNLTNCDVVANLTNLEGLGLGQNRLTNCSCISGLTNLTYLDLQNNDISDISCLAGLTKMYWLLLGGNPITDISPVSGLTDLVYLNFGYCTVSDISALSGLTKLWGLLACYSQIKDIGPLANLSNLTALDIDNNLIQDISPLTGLINLTQLWLNVNQISNVSPLLEMTNLTFLNIECNPLEPTTYCEYMRTILNNNPNLKEEDFYRDYGIAYNPSPADDAEVENSNLILSWTTNSVGKLQDVYFGDNYANVSDGVGGTFHGNQVETDFVVGLPGCPYPNGLVPGKTYFWRIDEVEDDGMTVCKGDIWSFTVAGPLEVTAEYQVAASKDDGYATNDSLQNMDSAYLKVGYSSFTQPPYYASGMIFRNVDIPQGAEIISANLKIRAYNSRLSDLVYGKIQAEATDNAADFGAFRNIGTLPKTNASVNWDLDESWAADTWYPSPDISGVIQEVIDRGGWSEGNALAIIYSTRQNEGGYRNISSFDRGSDYAPILEITYIP